MLEEPLALDPLKEIPTEDVITEFPELEMPEPPPNDDQLILLSCEKDGKVNNKINTIINNNDFVIPNLFWNLTPSFLCIAEMSLRDADTSSA